MPYDTELDELYTENDKLLDEIDDIINEIGRIISEISDENSEFICSECISAAKALYRIIEKHAREEDAKDILEQFACETGINLKDD